MSAGKLHLSFSSISNYAVTLMTLDLTDMGIGESRVTSRGAETRDQETRVKGQVQIPRHEDSTSFC